MIKTLNSIDLNEIKENLKSYLRKTTEFKDMDFEASGAASMLNVLSYAIFYMTFYQNMTVDELFLQTTKIRENAVSLAKSLSYQPRRYMSTRGSVELLANNVLTPVIIDKYTTFTSDTGYKFVAIDPIYIGISYDEPKISKVFLSLKQGIRKSQIFEYQLVSQIFELDYGKEIENESLNVFVNGVLWQQYNGDLALNFETEKYFVEENYRGKLEVRFGNNILGKSPEIDDIIEIEYIVSDGEAANDSTSFTLDEALYDVDGVPFPANEISFENPEVDKFGAYEEDIESIKINAPMIWETQNRAVTALDYIAWLSRINFIKNIVVWGGETAIPAVYGTVFISVEPKWGDYLSKAQNDYIIHYLKKINVLSIHPKLLEPFYIYNKINILVKFYKDGGFRLSKIDSDINNGLITYYNRLNRLSEVKYSELVCLVTNVDGVSSCDLSILKYIKISPTVTNTYDLKIYNKIKRGSIKSDKIYDKDEKLYLISTNEKVGSIDYEIGRLVFNGNFIDENEIIEFETVDVDIYSKFNNIIQLNDIDIKFFGV